MPDDPRSRRLTTIVALDVAGYSARTETDEARTTAEVAALRRVIEGIATAQGGRVFNTAGDGFTSFSTKAIDPAVYDLYLHASPKSYAPEELRTNVALLEVATQRAPNFAEAWGRLASLRAWLRFYQPFADRAASAGLVANEAERALALDPQNVDALLAQFFVIPPSDGSSKPTRSWGG